MSVDDISPDETEDALEFQKHLRIQIEWIGILRSDLKRIASFKSFMNEAELAIIGRNIRKLRDDEYYYTDRLSKISIPKAQKIYIATYILVDKAERELSELEKDWKELYKRY
jgi:uncharacterized protein YdeI (BOF family)